jgi:HAD superfamily hydrolase (TIGR01509 family)
MLFKNIFWRGEIKLVCFDLDNTLYDYSIGESVAEASIAQDIGKLCKKKKNLRSISIKYIMDVLNEIKHSHMHHDMDPKGYSRSLWIKETMLKIGLTENNDLYSKTLEKKYWNILTPEMKMFQNTIKTLDAIKSISKYRIATITDSDGERGIKIQRMKSMDIYKYFDYVITTDDTGKNKPAIENWQHLIKISGVNPKECIMIGDHPDVDLVNAKKLGFITVWTKEHIPSVMHYKYVDHEINDIGELIGILKKYR